MAERAPTTTLDKRFSSPDATPTPWTAGQQQLQDAQVSWITTIRADGRPHLAPLMTIWLDGALYFCTGANEQKALNLARNARCIVLTGNNAMDAGLDVVVEGDARNVTDDKLLRSLAELYVAKYGEGWRFDVHEGAFYHSEHALRKEHTARALVFEVVPATAFGFGRGEQFSQTRWRFG